MFGDFIPDASILIEAKNLFLLFCTLVHLTQRTCIQENDEISWNGLLNLNLNLI